MLRKVQRTWHTRWDADRACCRAFPKLAGVSYGQRLDFISKYCARFTAYDLERDCKNKFDSNAIKVLATKHRLEIGWIPKKLAKQLAPLMDAGREFKVQFIYKVVDEETGRARQLIIKIWEADVIERAKAAAN